MTLVDLWPVFGVRVRTPVLELFVPWLVAVSRLAAKGIYDPQNHYLPRTPVAGWEDVPSPEAERRFLRHYWAFYQPNGTTTRAAEGKRVEQVNLTLRRDDWPADTDGYSVSGLTPDAMAMFNA